MYMSIDDISHQYGDLSKLAWKFINKTGVGGCIYKILSFYLDCMGFY